MEPRALLRHHALENLATCFPPFQAKLTNPKDTLETFAIHQPCLDHGRPMALHAPWLVNTLAKLTVASGIAPPKIWGKDSPFSSLTAPLSAVFHSCHNFRMSSSSFSWMSPRYMSRASEADPVSNDQSASDKYPADTTHQPALQTRAASLESNHLLSN